VRTKLDKGMRRALLVGVTGALFGGFRSYSKLKPLLPTILSNRQFKRLASLEGVKRTIQVAKFYDQQPLAPARTMTKNLYYESTGTVHYNVHFKNGSLANRVTQRDLCGLRPVDIDWLWIVEARRRAAPDEIRKLCKLVQEI
jgi:hypothetical protein